DAGERAGDGVPHDAAGTGKVGHHDAALRRLRVAQLRLDHVVIEPQVLPQWAAGGDADRHRLDHAARDAALQAIVEKYADRVLRRDIPHEAVLDRAERCRGEADDWTTAGLALAFELDARNLDTVDAAALRRADQQRGAVAHAA